MKFTGSVYRAMQPKYGGTPMSTVGSVKSGGRFNRKGLASLYTSIDLQTASLEFSQSKLILPHVLVMYQIEVDQICDMTDLSVAASFSITGAQMSSDSWRDQVARTGTCPTQDFADELLLRGFSALLVPSYVPTPSGWPNGRNLVLYEPAFAAPNSVEFHDPTDSLAAIRT